MTEINLPVLFYITGEEGIEPSYHGFGDQAISNYLYSPLAAEDGIEPSSAIKQTAVLYTLASHHYTTPPILSIPVSARNCVGFSKN